MMLRHFERWPAALSVALSIAGGVACSDPFGPQVPPEARAFAELVNEHRGAAGCPTLEWDAEVAEVAQAHSEDMVARGFFAHDNPDGDSPFDRLSAAGITYSRAAENIAAGYSTADAVLQGWLNSSGHRRNIENCGLLQHGVGLAEGRWTHVFVTR